MEQTIFLPGAHPERSTITDDGLILDADTGEVLGFAPVEPTAPANPIQTGIKTAADLDWVMEKLLAIQSQLESIDHRPEVLAAAAVLANAEAMKKPYRHRYDWYLSVFEAGIGDFARANLPKKSKTLKTLFGSISFRSSKAKLELRDKDRAARWLAERFPVAVRVTARLGAVSKDEREFIASMVADYPEAVSVEVLRTEIPADVMTLAAANESFEAESGIAYVPERESMTVTPGAKPKKSHGDATE
jgi:hypothetical protein